MPDLNLSALSDEELQQLEGDERHNLEARIHCLRNINTLLNGAFINIQQYMNMTMASRYDLSILIFKKMIFYYLLF